MEEVPLEAARLNVPPAQAPTQQKYIPAHCNTDPDISNAQHHAWYPRCQKMSGECGGRTRTECQYLGHRAANSDFVEEMMNKKRAENNCKRAEKAREKRIEHSVVGWYYLPVDGIMIHTLNITH